MKLPCVILYHVIPTRKYIFNICIYVTPTLEKTTIYHLCEALRERFHNLCLFNEEYENIYIYICRIGVFNLHS